MASRREGCVSSIWRDACLTNTCARRAPREGIARIGWPMSSWASRASAMRPRSATSRGPRRTACAEHFSDARIVLVNADGGSEDGTPDRVAESGRDARSHRALRRTARQGLRVPGDLRTAVALDVRACAVVDTDLRSITPEWIARLLGPIVRGEADYVTPMYARHKHDGTITNSVAYPLTRALYGLRIRQPIGGEFGFRADLARALPRRAGLGQRRRALRHRHLHDHDGRRATVARGPGVPRREGPRPEGSRGGPRPDVHAGRRHALPASRTSTRPRWRDVTPLEGRPGHRRRPHRVDPEAIQAIPRACVRSTRVGTAEQRAGLERDLAPRSPETIDAMVCWPRSSSTFLNAAVWPISASRSERARPRAASPFYSTCVSRSSIEEALRHDDPAQAESSRRGRCGRDGEGEGERRAQVREDGAGRERFLKEDQLVLITDDDGSLPLRTVQPARASTTTTLSSSRASSFA